MSLHNDALAALEAWPAPDARQERLRHRIVDHLRAHPDGVYRECLPDHLTAGLLVLSPDLDRVLLNLHGKAGRWFAFGGHCEPEDTTLAGAALREGREESGLGELRLDPVPVHVDVHEVPFCAPGHRVHHLDVRFTALAAADDAHQASAESLDVRWWPLDALPEELESDMRELIGLARDRWAAAPTDPA